MEIINSKIVTHLELPFFTNIQAGFPSPAENEDLRSIDLNEHLIKHQAATFFMRVRGDSMIGRGIFEGDIIIVDKSLTPKSGNVIVGLLNCEFTLKELSIIKEQITLIPANKDYPIIQIKEGDEFQVWGVVTNVIHNLI